MPSALQLDGPPAVFVVAEGDGIARLCICQSDANGCVRGDYAGGQGCEHQGQDKEEEGFICCHVVKLSSYY
jgi:hypothetical protein